MRKRCPKPTRRRYPLNRIKQGGTYEPIDIVRLFGIHRNTVAHWLKQGLKAIDDRRPILIHGTALKRFLSSRQEARRQTCRLDQLLCFRCRAPRSAWGDVADVFPVTDKTAKLSALCSECETPMHRMVRRADLPKIAGLIDLPTLALTLVLASS